QLVSQCLPPRSEIDIGVHNNAKALQAAGVKLNIQLVQELVDSILLLYFESANLVVIRQVVKHGVIVLAFNQQHIRISHRYRTSISSRVAMPSLRSSNSVTTI